MKDNLEETTCQLCRGIECRLNEKKDVNLCANKVLIITVSDPHCLGFHFLFERNSRGAIGLSSSEQTAHGCQLESIANSTARAALISTVLP